MVGDIPLSFYYKMVTKANNGKKNIIEKIENDLDIELGYDKVLHCYDESK